MIYLYAIIDSPDQDLPDQDALDAQKLSQLVYRDIAAVYSSFQPDRESAVLATSQENLWKHEAVLETLMTAHALLPLRFGTVFAAPPLLEVLLQEKYDKFSANLARVHGCVELSLHLNLQDDAFLSQPTADDPQLQFKAALPRFARNDMNGKEYMAALLRARKHEQDYKLLVETRASEILQSLDDLAVEYARTVPEKSTPVLKSAYLIKRANLEHFQQEVNNLAAAFPDCHFAMTGPWPPYNFINN